MLIKKLINLNYYYYLLLRKKPCFFLNFEKRVEEKEDPREKGKVVVDGGIEMTQRKEV
jgi:hypothetical protein